MSPNNAGHDLERIPRLGEETVDQRRFGFSQSVCPPGRLPEVGMFAVPIVISVSENDPPLDQGSPRGLRLEARRR